MNRREFLRKSLTAAVTAALPAAFFAEAVAPKPVFVGQIGHFYNLRFVQGYSAGKSAISPGAPRAALMPAIKFKHPPALRDGDVIEASYHYYADPKDDLVALIHSMPDYKPA